MAKAKALVTGSGGLIGSESVRHFVDAGFDVVGLENDMRSRLFGAHASTRNVTDGLLSELGDSFRSLESIFGTQMPSSASSSRRSPTW